MYNGQIRDYRSATVQFAVGKGHTYPSAGTQNKYKQLETAKFWCKKTHPKRPPSKKLTLNKIYRNKYSRHAAGAQAKRGCGASGRGYAHARNTKEHIRYAAKRAHAALAISGIRQALVLIC